MKLCILSMQRVQNFGSLLQSYALKKLLEQQGHTVSFLDIERRDGDDALRGDALLDFSGESHAGSGLLSKLKKLDRYTINRLRIRHLSGKQEEAFEQFRTSVLGIRDDSGNSRYDCCVIGSDEVFNCMTKAWWGFTSQLFGDVKQADNVITYAASCGATTLAQLPEPVSRRIREAFEKVSAFSVRDRNTLQLVCALTENHVAQHLDPVLVGDFEEEIRTARLPDGLPERYCVVYSYYNRMSSKQEIRAITAFCEKHNLVPVTVGAPQMWIKNHLVAEPFAMLRVFQNAEFVITDTFHGTIFSAKFARRFAVMVRPSNENKLKDLIEKLGLEKHLTAGPECLEGMEVYRVDSSAVGQITAAEREKTLQYLHQSLHNAESF